MSARTLELEQRVRRAGCTDAGLDDTTAAAVLARHLLRDVGSRLDHTRRVARQAGRAVHLLAEPWRSALVDAAWLHDIGYAPGLVDSGFHSLDGACWLREQGWAAEVCRLVAHHTRAAATACLLGLADVLVSEFPEPPALAVEALSWADLTSSPGGALWRADRRLLDILSRYPAGSAVHHSTLASLPQLLGSAQRIEELLDRLEAGAP